MKTGFRITMGKGMQFTFENGYTVSVQIGLGNYCDNHFNDDAIFFGNNSPPTIKIGRNYKGDLRCPNAEIAIMDKDDEFVITDVFGSHDGAGMYGHCSPDFVANVIKEVASWK